MSVPRPTEMTIRSLLLRELDKRGVKVTPEVSFSTPVGRMMPDALLRNGGDYVIETKLGAEAKLFDALIRLYDYSKYTEARGAFAILFPEQLRRPMPLKCWRRLPRTLRCPIWSLPYSRTLGRPSVFQATYSRLLTGFRPMFLRRQWLRRIHPWP
ncbi:MAG: hypothetical protein QW231_01980 [Candidatus Bathyarchaeia archaeon]